MDIVSYREVSESEFYQAIGGLDVHPRIDGQYPYTSVFLDKGRVVRGVIRPVSADIEWPPVYRHLLPI